MMTNKYRERTVEEYLSDIEPIEQDNPYAAVKGRKHKKKRVREIKVIDNAQSARDKKTYKRNQSVGRVVDQIMLKDQLTQKELVKICRGQHLSLTKGAMKSYLRDEVFRRGKKLRKKRCSDLWLIEEQKEM